MRIAAWIIALCWGIGQNLPTDRFYGPGRTSPGDFLFLALMMVLLADRRTRDALLAEADRLRQLLALITVFVMLTALSCFANAFSRDMFANDFIEMFRPFYYFAIVVFISVCTQRDGPTLLVPFLTGIAISGYVAYLNPGNDDVFGFPVLWNPNVVGNMLAMGVLWSSLLVFEGRLATASVFLLVFSVLSIFTYSKGTWLMILLSSAAVAIAVYGGAGARGRHIGKFLFMGVTAVLVGLGTYFYEPLSALVEFKIFTTQLGDTAAEGGTAAARWGFVVASTNMAADNPLFGVGISNYEATYRTMERELGNAFWATDNPHSAWLYILACIGVPALIVFGLIILRVLRTLAARVPLAMPLRQAYIGIVAVVFLISGSVMLEILTQYFFWFFAGVVCGWRVTDRQGPGRDARQPAQPPAVAA